LTSVLLSIKPTFVERIFEEEKRFEFRRSIFVQSVSKAIVYCTSPVKLILGEFEIGEILEGTPEDIWEKCSLCAGISKMEYDEYFVGSSRAYAITIEKPNRYTEPIDPRKDMVSFVAPQSFRYFK